MRSVCVVGLMSCSLTEMKCSAYFIYPRENLQVTSSPLDMFSHVKAGLSVFWEKSDVAFSGAGAAHVNQRHLCIESFFLHVIEERIY